MLETSARLLRLLSLLQTPREWTGPQLAERLGAGAQLPPLLLDDEEAVAVAVGLRTAASGSISGIEETSLRALAKVEKVLPSRLRRRVSALQTYVASVSMDTNSPRVDASVLTELTAACRDRELVRFEYEDRGKTGSRRTAEPYGLVNWGRRWYLVAWDRDREDWRTFRVDRMTPKSPAGPRFSPRELPDEDLARYVSDRVSAAPWRIAAQITIHAPAAVVAERVPAHVGPIQSIDAETCVLSSGNDNVEMFAVYLGMIGFDFTVTSPPELVEAVRKLGQRYAKAVSC